MRMNGISTFLWFADEAEAAAEFYVSVFPNSAVTNVTRQGDPVGGELAPALMVSFELDGRPFTALNGGPVYTFSPAISFVVSCEGQAEVTDAGGRRVHGMDVPSAGVNTLMGRHPETPLAAPNA